MPVAVAQDFRQPARGLVVDEPEGLSKRYVKGMAHGEALSASRSTALSGVPSLDRRRAERNFRVAISGRCRMNKLKGALLCPCEPRKVPLH